jgi:hypothetical protein
MSCNLRLYLTNGMSKSLQCLLTNVGHHRFVYGWVRAVVALNSPNGLASLSEDRLAGLLLNEPVTDNRLGLT